jgi:hypothetical protein
MSAFGGEADILFDRGCLLLTLSGHEAGRLGVTNGTILDQKCDILLDPMVSSARAKP